MADRGVHKQLAERKERAHHGKYCREFTVTEDSLELIGDGRECALRRWQ